MNTEYSCTVVPALYTARLYRLPLAVASCVLTPSGKAYRLNTHFEPYCTEHAVPRPFLIPTEFSDTPEAVAAEPYPATALYVKLKPELKKLILGILTRRA
jgi:hypothetical protein